MAPSAKKKAYFTINRRQGTAAVKNTFHNLVNGDLTLEKFFYIILYICIYNGVKLTWDSVHVHEEKGCLDHSAEVKVKRGQRVVRGHRLLLSERNPGEAKVVTCCSYPKLLPSPTPHNQW